MEKTADNLLTFEPARPTVLARWRDFIALTKPRMNLLVLITTAVGFYMAARTGTNWTKFVHAMLGTALTAASAAILNQFAESEHDARMPRTRKRPIPAGKVQPQEALLLGILCGTFGVNYLALAVNPLTAMLGAMTLGLYVFVYTPLKRITTLNTVIGAVPGAIPPVMGWTAASNSLSSEALALFLILFLWQIPHFLAIATMYRNDYAAGGFKMLPVIDEDLSMTGRQSVLYAIALVPASLMPVWLGLSGWLYAIPAVLLGSAFLHSAIRLARHRTRLDARRLFLISIIYLPLLLGALMLEKAI